MIHIQTKNQRWNDFLDLVIFTANKNFEAKKDYNLCQILVDVHQHFKQYNDMIFKLSNIINNQPNIHKFSTFKFIYPKVRFSNKNYLQIRIDFLKSLKK